MTVAVLEPLDHDLGVIAAIETLGLPVFYAGFPRDAIKAAAEAVAAGSGDDYFVLYPLDGGERDGTAADPDELAVLPYQITVVGKLPDGVRSSVRELERVLPGVSITGRHVMRVEPTSTGAVRPDPDDDRVVIATPRWNIHTSPTP